MRGNFDKCFPVTCGWEGWHKFTNNPKDPGGATYCGVTQRTFDGYCDRKGIARADVRTMTDAQCGEIYLQMYWTPIHAEQLPAGVDLLAYDMCVNSGPYQAALILQRALGVTADGAIGPATLAAADKADRAAVIQAMHEGRLSFWRKLTTWSTFGKGWTNREIDVARRAFVMARTAS